jgi:hypothetical protein
MMSPATQFAVRSRSQHALSEIAGISDNVPVVPHDNVSWQDAG